MNITEPLRLAVGHHRAGSGKGCAMDVISWENGDTQITDLSGCADHLLAFVVQRVNDAHCTHRAGKDLLCPPCSLEVLALAHRTVGTNLDHLSDLERRRIYVRLALDEAESVAHPAERAAVTRCREVTQRWLDGRATSAEVRGVRRGGIIATYGASAVYAAAVHAAGTTVAAAIAAAGGGDGGDVTYSAANAAASAANAAASASSAYAASASSAYAANPAATHTCATYAANATSYAAASAATYGAGIDGLRRAHALIDRFEKLTGIHARPVTVEQTAVAIQRMAVKA